VLGQRLRSIALAGLLSLSQALGAPPARASQPRARVAARQASNRILIRYREGDASTASTGIRFSSASRDMLRALSGLGGQTLTYVREASGNTHVYAFNTTDAAAQQQAIDRLHDNAESLGIASIERDRWIGPTLSPNDAQFGEQWSLQAISAGNIGADFPAAWAVTTGTATVTIAILDTGILSTHMEFAGRVLPGYDFVTDVSLANDGNGRDNNPADPGDWVTSAEAAAAGGPYQGCVVGDSSWHGTHVAGIIAARGNNGAGIAGANWQARILPVRILGKCGGYLSDEIDGIRWSAGLPVPGVPRNPNPARIINMSLGGPGACEVSEQNAINDAVAAGAIVIVAAGNSAVDVANSAPANCAGVVSVGATNRAGNRASYSNFGSGITLSAPGGDGTNAIL
jgi:serine protease